MSDVTRISATDKKGLKFTLVVPKQPTEARPIVSVENATVLAIYSVGKGQDIKETHPKDKNGPVAANYELIIANEEYGPLNVNRVEMEAIEAVNSLLHLLPEGPQKEAVKEAAARLQKECTLDEQGYTPPPAPPRLFSQWNP
jgi:hypothetical protein